jgi:hypothetical protein
MDQMTFVLKNCNIGSSILNKSLRIKRERSLSGIILESQRLGFTRPLA